MQEKLILKPTIEHHIENIDLDYTKLSASEEFGEKLEQFNQRYEVELVATKSARWQPGTYNKLKNWVPNVLYPHWKRRRGANSINKLLQQDEWRYNNFTQNLQRLDDMLFHYRKDGVELYADDDINEAKNILQEIITLLSIPTDGITLNIGPVPYFGKRARYMEYNNAIGKDNRLFPVIDKNMDVIGTYNTDTYDTMTDYDTLRTQMIEVEKHPGKWYVNILVALNDVNIKVTNRDMDREYGNFPYGDMIIGLTVDFMTLCTNYKRINNKRNMIKTDCIGNGTTIFPYYSAIQHPFVSRTHNGQQDKGHFTSYGNGNTCFGDLATEIYKSFLTGNLKMLKTYLKIWSSSYTAGTTSPLNSPQYFHFGKPKEWNAMISSHISTDTSLCRTQIKYGIDKEMFKDKFCNNCTLTNDCSTYSKLLFVDLDFKQNADKHWRQTFGQICDYFDGDLTEEIINEIFNDLYYYLECTKTVNMTEIKKIFMLRNEHNYYLTYTAKDKEEWEAFQEVFKENPMDNLKEMFHRAERVWILERIAGENTDMFHQLIDKTKGMTFQESCEILPYQTIENNHYSWLYAIGSVTERKDYMTYYNILNHRKEGLRFAE